MAIEGNAQHGDRQDEGDVLALLVDVTMSFVDGPDDDADQEEDIDDFARVERTAQDVYEQELKPTSHLYDAWHYAIQYGSQDDYRQEQGEQRAFQVTFRVVGRELAIIVNQHDGRQTQQVQ